MPDRLGEPVELYRARDLSEADALGLALEGAGIPARVDDLRLLVDRADEPAARAVLEAFSRRVPTEPLPASLHIDLSLDGPAPAAGEPKPALLTRREIVWEVAAVMAVGVVPYVAGPVIYFGFQRFQQSNWRDSIHATLMDACNIFVTLYLIRRSGEPWARFGISRPRFVDLLLAPALLFVVRRLWIPLSAIVPNAPLLDDPLEVIRTPWDGVLSLLRYAVGALMEELVTRAYLITRFESLFGSRAWAVLVAAAMFSSYHVYQGPSGVLRTFLDGLVFGAAYLYLRRIWPLALAHLLHNILVDTR